MKLAVGDTYQEAVAHRPITGVNQHDLEGIEKILKAWKVVLDYKLIQNQQTRYYWKKYSKYWYYLLDRDTGDKVRRADNPDKILLFHNIQNAMEWAYQHDSEYYNSLNNLSINIGGK